MLHLVVVLLLFADRARCSSSPGGRLPQAGGKLAYVFAPAWKAAEAYKLYDWARLTDVCLFGSGILSPQTLADPQRVARVQDILAVAHAQGTRVHGNAFYPQEQLANVSSRTSWAAQVAQVTAALGLDGVNIDVEMPIAAGANASRQQLTQLVAEIRHALDMLAPRRQLSFDAAWSPDGIDGRHYDLVSISKHVDLIFVMAYDMQSQIWSSSCTAEANSLLPLVRQGLRSYLQLPIPAHQLVLGVPWYGYDYACLEGDQAVIRTDAADASSMRLGAAPQPKACHIARVPFRGAPCSDAAGSQVPIGAIYSALLRNATQGGIQWDRDAHSPYFDYVAAAAQLASSGAHAGGVRHRVRFDGPESLREKYKLAKELGLRGVGAWEADALGSGGSAEARQLRWRMYGALDAFLTP
jgi:Di-N-acetylchitobiase